MKKAILALVAVLTLLVSVETAKADWVLYTSNGFTGWYWDPAFDDGTFYPTPNKPPPTTKLYSVSVSITGVWWAIPY